MTASASCSRPSFEDCVEKCRAYWFEPPSDLNAQVALGDFCQVGRRPPPECMFDRLDRCKGRMLVDLVHNFPPPLPEIHVKLLWYAAFGLEVDGLADAKPAVEARFLEWLLTNPLAVRLIHHTGMRVRHITLDADLNLDTATLNFPVVIADSTLRRIILTNAHTHSISFEGSECSTINAAGITIDGSLHLTSHRTTSTTSEATYFHAHGPVDLTGARISGNLDCSGGHFTSRDLAVPALNTTLAHIHGSVLLSDVLLPDTPDKLLFDATGLILAKEMTVGGDLDCTNAKLRNTLGERHAISLDRSRIRGSVLLRNGFSATGEVRLIGTRISNDLDCSGAAFSNNDDGDGTRVTLETRNSHINHCVYLGGSLKKSHNDGTPNSSFQTDGLISFDFAQIGRDLLIGAHDDNNDGETTNTQLNTDNINIRNARVGGSLRCMADFNSVTLRLDNTHVDEFVTTDKMEFWPHSISLTRFVYNYMRFLPSEKATCFIKWLNKGNASPQQYEYLAGMLAKSGSPKEANTVLYASRERALAEARKQHNWPRWILMWLQKYTIGYGIGARYFRALLWVIPLTLIGFYVLSIGKANWDFRLLYPSFDNILPVIKLSYNKDDNVIDALNNLPLFVFNVIKVLGYILAIFIAAGFAGLTQKR